MLHEFERQVQEVDPAQSRAFHFIQVGALKMKNPDWLVKPLIERDSLVQLFGDPGAGKSLFSLDLGCCVSLGLDFHGQKTKQGAVLYIAGEGGNGIKRRLCAWEIVRGVTLKKAPLFISSGPAAFCDAEGVKAVREAIENLPEGVKQPGLLIVDTVARNFGPGDENSTKDMTLFIAGLDLIRVAFGCAILVVHHSGHADKSRGRGATALKGALDTEYCFSKDEQKTVRVICTKMKDSEVPQPMAFKIDGVDLGITDEDGQVITSAVMRPIPYEPAAEKNRSGKWETVGVKVLSSMLQENEQVSITAWRMACIAEGVPRTRFYDVKKQLLAGGIIEERYGNVCLS